MTLLVPLLIGVGFGAVLQRVGASRYDRILDTLRLRDLMILKFMLLAIGVAAIGVGGLALLGVAHLAIKPLYVVGVLSGGLLFGVGFALSGYCPGTGVVACAEGRRDAYFAVAGGLAAALAYTLLYPVLKPVAIDPLSFGQVTLGSAVGISPGLLAVPVGAAFVLLGLVLPRHPGRTAAATREP